MPRRGFERLRRGGLLRSSIAALICCAGLLAAGGPPARAAVPLADAGSSSAAWLDTLIGQVENEAALDAQALPDIPAALRTEWRSLDRNFSAIGTLADFGWMALIAAAALTGERLAMRGLGRRARRRLRLRAPPSLFALLALLGCDLVGLAAFIGIFSFCRRHFLPATGVSDGLAVLSANVLFRWRIAALVVRAVLRPRDPPARLVEVTDEEARRLARFLSGVLLAMIAIVGLSRYGEASGLEGQVGHVIGLLTALVAGALYLWAVIGARNAAEGLIAGRRRQGVIAVLRAACARSWVPAATALIAALIVLYAFGLTLGLLAYYYAVTSSLGILLVLLVLERLLERASSGDAAIEVGVDAAERAVARTFHRSMAGLLVLIAVVALARVWIDALGLSHSAARAARHSVDSAGGVLFIAFVVWEIGRLAIERHLQPPPGVSVPGADSSEEEVQAATRLQTILPFLRAAFGIALGVVAALVALSNLGVDTAPLIAGAGVFGLAVSFGSQSLVRDIISGLFYMWDDAFRVGEYIDTGRLKGTVETIGLRSVKVRHQNGPLHTIPYGQLGAVSNLSRDFATIKFNLRLDRGCDIESVRKAAKQIGIAMQAIPEIAAEVMLPLKMQGIVDVADTALVVRFKFTARPVKPSWVQREYMKQIHIVFAEKGIAFASGTLTVQTLAPPQAGAGVAPPLPLMPPSRVA